MAFKIYLTMIIVIELLNVDFIAILGHNTSFSRFTLLYFILIPGSFLYVSSFQSSNAFSAAFATFSNRYVIFSNVVNRPCHGQVSERYRLLD